MNSTVKSKGMSFIEILISIVLVTITFVLIISVLTLGLKSLQKSKNYSIATSLAQSKLEKIKSMYYPDIIEGNEPVVDEYSGKFFIDVSVLELDYGATFYKYKQLIVEVYNTEILDMTKSSQVKLVTIFSQE